MACGKVVEIKEGPGTFHHGSKLYESVAPDARIGSPAIEIFTFEVLEDCGFIKVLKVYSVVDNSKLAADLLGLIEFFLFLWVVAGGGGGGRLKVAVLLPDQHSDPFHFISSLLQ